MTLQGKRHYLLVPFKARKSLQTPCNLGDTQVKPWSVIKWSFICFIFYLCFLYVCGKRFDVDKAEREGNTLWLTLSQNGVWDYIFEWKRAFILANHVNKFLQLRSCKIMHQFTYIRIVTVKLWSKVWNLTLNIYIIKCIGCGNCINENEFLHSTRDEFKFISCIVKILLFFFFLHSYYENIFEVSFIRSVSKLHLQGVSKLL